MIFFYSTSSSTLKLQPMLFLIFSIPVLCCFKASIVCLLMFRLVLIVKVAVELLIDYKGTLISPC